MASDDSATLSTTASISSETSNIYDLRQEDEMSASTSSTHDGYTILSSAPGSSAPLREDGRASSGMIHVPIVSSSLSLSLNPSMIDSSVIIPAERNDNGNWIGLHRTTDVSSQSSMTTSSDISSCGSVTISAPSSPCYAPELFANIGRSLVLASVSSGEYQSESECDSLSKSSALVASSGKRVKWWDQLQTDQDWDNFRTKANDHLNELVAAEMKESKTLVTKRDATQQNSIWHWLQGFYDALTATVMSQDNSTGTTYLSSLIKEVADIQQQLERLPPAPPTLPDDLPLEALPSLVQYRDRLDDWRGKVMPQREELTARYVQCQEKLLAAIIDAEEEMFYKRTEEGDGRGGNKDGLGAVNGDGYIEIVDKKSPEWDGVNEELIASQSKCQLTLLNTAFVAALTAGAAFGANFFLTLQSKRR